MSEHKALFPNARFSEEDNFSWERELYRQGFKLVAGTDEAGRGPLAGPVVAACVILPKDCDHLKFRDSKTITSGKRQELYGELREIGAEIGVGTCDPGEIDRLNILQASLLAMKKAMEALKVEPDFLLVDGKFKIPSFLSQKSLVKGESRSASIAAASIVAKEERDKMMEQYHRKFPQYNFPKHKGYPTAEHRRLIMEHGPCEIHRRSFRGVREYLVEIDEK